jgi:endonuclease/exonuclease/phosphatase (EEP) superfamily protein YafD
MFKSRYSALESLKIVGNDSHKEIGPIINLLLWNLYKCKKNGWQEDFRNLIQDKDLILLQEAILNSPFDSQFIHSLQHQWIMARSFKDLKNNFETGVKTGSTVAATKHTFAASVHGEPITKTKKMLLATYYPLHTFSQPLLVVNSHLINFVSFEKFKAHVDQIFQHLQHHEGPIILAGDFNTWNGKRLKYFNGLARSLLLNEVKLQRQPRLLHLFQHLDHIYYRGLEVICSQVMTDVRSSDHFPVSVRFRAI